MTPTTAPTHTCAPALETHDTEDGTTRGLTLRAISWFIPLPSPQDRRYADIASRVMTVTGERLLWTARAALPAGTQLESLREILPPLDGQLLRARSRGEAEAITHEEFLIREQAVTELNRRAVETYGAAAPRIFFGGFCVSAHRVPGFAMEGFLDAAVRDLPTSAWQFGVANLGDASSGIHQSGLERTAEAIRAMHMGGSHFGAMFGAANNTPFCPCAQNVGGAAGVAVCMSSPGALLAALHAEPATERAEAAVRRTQREALRGAAAVGQRMAAALGTRFFGCDPSQAPAFDAENPGSNSIGAAIELFSGVPLGAPGTKDGFYRLMHALRLGSADSGAPLCGFQGGSFLPISEDDVVAAAVASKRLSYSCLLSLCHVCAAGLDMAVVDPSTSSQTIARVLRDVAVTHLLKGKTLAARLIVPERGITAGPNGYYNFGGLLGSAPVLPLDPDSF